MEKCIETGVFGAAGGNAARRLMQILEGDRLVLYAKGGYLAGLATVTTSVYEDKTPIWEDGVYPLRIKFKLEKLAPSDRRPLFKDMLAELDFIRHKGNLGLNFQTNLREVSQKDWEILGEALTRAAKTK